MTIAKKVIADFLNRRLDDYSFLKDWKRKDLLEEFKHLPVRPRFTSPHKHWHHQLVCLLLCCIFPGFMLFADVGSGKTRVILEAFGYRRRTKEARTGLIAVLNDVNVYNWLDDAAEHTPQLRVEGLFGSAEERWETFDAGRAHLYVVSFAGLRNMLQRKDENAKKKMQPHLPSIKKMASKIQFIAYDEIHKCKNHKSLTYRIARKLSQTIPFRYGATGTGFGRNPIDLWAEFFLIDLGETLATTLGLFRESFFTKKTGFGGWKEWTFDKRNFRLLRKTIRHRSIYYKDSEIGDMPKRRRRKILLRPPVSLQEYYNKALESLQVAARNEELENNWIRLRMICSGFISYKDEDTDKIEIALPDNPKIGALEDFTEAVPIGGKGVVVHEFVYSGKIIENTMRDLGIPICCLNGRMKPAEKKQAYRDFRKTDKYKFLVMNWRTGGTGLDLPMAPYMHFYETPVSPIERKQCEGRVRRRNSTARRVYYSDSIIKGSVEEDIMEFLKEGRNMYTEIMSGKKSSKRRRKGIKKL